ncbi:MAG: hypothetical protein EBZ51_01355 [Synechococcaceae bacterium WB9_2_112]|nr:hypothetical protein [Synechococcaceae bacterium WB9_2_112]
MAQAQFGQSGMELGGAAAAVRPAGHAEHQHQTWDAMESYFECITTCSLDDGECVTRCVDQLREQG